MKKTWKEIKKERLEVVGHRCEVCGVSKEVARLVGHHVLSKGSKKGFSAEFCRIRCPECERMMHRIFKGGNGPQEKRRES